MTDQTQPEPVDEADGYRNAVGVAIAELEKLGMVDRLDGKPDGPAVLNATGVGALSHLLVFWQAQTYDAPDPAVRLSHHVGVAFGSALAAAMAAVGDVAPTETTRAYQHALTTVRHLRRTVEG